MATVVEPMGQDGEHIQPVAYSASRRPHRELGDLGPFEPGFRAAPAG